MPHHFTLSSDFEKTWQPIADSFYKSKYSNCVIKRYNSDSKEDLEFQKKDIDLTLILPDRSIHISEKFRKDDYGDLLIELYSKYPNVKGWMSLSEAYYLAYFTPQKVYIVNKGELQKWYQLENFEDKFYSEIQTLYENNIKKSSRKEMSFVSRQGNPISLNLIQAYNKTQDAEWYTVSVAISWENLKKEGLHIKQYPI